MTKTKQTDQEATVVSRYLSKTDEFARQQPTKAALSAFGVGFLINLLPIGMIVGALVSIVFAMARPALLFLGLMKACDLYQAKNNPQSNTP